MDINKMQVNETISLVDTAVTNAARAIAMGFETEATARVISEVSLTGSYGYTRITFDEFSDSAGDYKGNTNPLPLSTPLALVPIQRELGRVRQGGPCRLRKDVL